MAKRDVYAVGYGKPPAETQFKPGVSGNPRGKPRGAKGLKAELAAELAELVKITINGREKRVPKLRLILKALAAKAANGNVAAADKLLSLVIQSQGFEDTRPGRAALSDTDRMILQLALGGDDSVSDGRPAQPEQLEQPEQTDQTEQPEQLASDASEADNQEISDDH